jgi:hypothetical protein
LAVGTALTRIAIIGAGAGVGIGLTALAYADFPTGAVVVGQAADTA